MIAILWNQIVCITMIVAGEMLHKWPEFWTRHVSTSQMDRTSKDKTRTTSRFNLKHSTCWVLMSSKSIFQVMCYFKELKKKITKCNKQKSQRINLRETSYKDRPISSRKFLKACPHFKVKRRDCSCIAINTKFILSNPFYPSLLIANK